jgi:formylglycine-generating enzyme required for sulfatase activity
LKGRWRPVRLLQEAAAYGDRPGDFAELMGILDDELRMVTPVDRSSLDVEGNGQLPGANDVCYQLTHDYLVPPLRQWLSSKQRETRQGRALLQLAATTALWRDRQESRRLPSLFEWIKIVCFTRHRAWSTDERRMMRAATRRVLTGAALAVLVAASVATLVVTTLNRERARAALESALEADYENLPRLVPEIATHATALRPALETLEKSPATPPHELAVAEILLYRQWPTPARARFLADSLPTAGPELVNVIGDALAARPNEAGLDNLRRTLLDESTEPAARLRVACLLAKLEPARAASWTTIAAPLAEALLAESRREAGRWIELLGLAGSAVVPPLATICRDGSRESTARSAAAEALSEILERARQPLTLAEITVDALPDASHILLRELVSLGPSAPVLDYLRGLLSERVGDPADEPAKDARASRQTAAAIALAGLGEPESLWPLLRHRADPRVRSLLIQRLAANPLPARTLLDHFAQAGIDSTELQALLLMWAEMRPAAAAAPVRATVIATARRLYGDDPDPGVHSAAELLLRRWGGPDVLDQCDAEMRERPSVPKGSRWELGPNGHTFAILPGPLEFRMGASPHETAHYGDPVLHYRKIDRSLMVATKEVTVEQFQEFHPSHRNEPRYGDEPQCAAIHISWYAAAAYCNWLSEQAGIDRSQWCYPEKVEPGMVISEASVTRTGFRLPTEAEWEYFCRAGAETARPYGESSDLLGHYAWTWLNSGNRAMPPGQLLPNEFGLFDVLGNVWEWCQDGPEGHYRYPDSKFPAYPTGTRETPAADPIATETVDAIDRAHETWRILRGGAFSYAPDRARSAFRDWEPSSDNREYLGVRVVRTLPQRD